MRFKKGAATQQGILQHLLTQQGVTLWCIYKREQFFCLVLFLCNQSYLKRLPFIMKPRLVRTSQKHETVVFTSTGPMYFVFCRLYVFSPQPSRHCLGPITKYVYMKSTTVHVPSSELGLSQPLSRHNSDDWRKSLALCLLCGSYPQGAPPFLHVATAGTLKII